MTFRIISAFLIFTTFSFKGIAQVPKTTFELSDSANTATYVQTNTFYKSLAKKYPKSATFFTIGNSDGGHPIYVFHIKGKSASYPNILINNAIHPGEPEGVDASMMLCRDLLQSKQKAANYNLYVIVMYNTDGALNRNKLSRANQNGPEINGFRGTSLNLDLNRDFIKTDSRNTKAFVSFFHKINPLILVDNHTSNGADYQYTLTYFSSHESKLLPSLNTLRLLLKPGLESGLLEKGFPTCPYVETRKETPDSGIVAFFETGRYATGFASLHNCLGYTVETHMLKPFKDRVMGTYFFMQQLLNEFNKLNTDTSKNIKIITQYPSHSKTTTINKGQMFLSHIELERNKTTGQNFPIQWTEDHTFADSIEFLGYQASHIPSTWGKHNRLFYDRSKPYKKNVAYYNHYKAIDSTFLPTAFIIPQAWHQVIDRLQLNKVTMSTLKKDTIIQVHAKYITDYKSTATPYESHYMHYGTKTHDTIFKVQFYKGDYYIPCNQSKNRFIAETLDPKAPDSYFNWNFFDGILQQKEGYSGYVFEDDVPAILANNPSLKSIVDKMLLEPDAANNGHKIMSYIFNHSGWHEKTHNLYPVFGVE